MSTVLVYPRIVIFVTSETERTELLEYFKFRDLFPTKHFEMISRLVKANLEISTNHERQLLVIGEPFGSLDAAIEFAERMKKRNSRLVVVHYSQRSMDVVKQPFDRHISDCAKLVSLMEEFLI